MTTDGSSGDTEGSNPGGYQVTRRGVLAGVSGLVAGSAFSLTGSQTASAAQEFDALEQSVRLTPRPDTTDVGGTRSLGGTWDFAMTTDSSAPSSPGDVATDASGSGNDGTLLNSPSIVSGQSGDAVDCAGSSYVEVGTSGSLDFTSPGFTFQITFQYSQDTVLFSKGNDQYGAGVYGNQLSFWTKGDGNWPTAQGGSLTTGTWYTATFVVDSSELRIYLDGTQVGSTSHTASSVPSTSSPPHIAYNSGNGSNGMPVVDEFRVFDEALAASQIDGNIASDSASTVCWLTFDTLSSGTASFPSNSRTEPVPGQWAYDGYFVPQSESDWYPPSGERGWYRRTFSVPSGWENGQLKLRFGAVYSKAWVYLNGTQIATHVGGYTPFEVDIGDVVDPNSSNTLDVVVDQRSKADDLSWFNVTGGIVRDVELVSVPDVHLSETVVTPSLQGLDGAPTATDESGSGNDGILVNSPSIVTGQSGSAVDCAGSGYVEIGTTGSLDFVEPGFSFQVTFEYSEDTILFSKGNDQYSAGVYGGQLSFWTYGDGNWPTVQGGSLTTGTWYTATFVMDSSAMRIYVDGTEVASTSHSVATVPQVDSPPHIAYDASDGTTGTPVVDEFRAFDSALTASEISAGFSSVPEDAACWLTFDNVSAASRGTVTVDAYVTNGGGSSADGTVTVTLSDPSGTQAGSTQESLTGLAAGATTRVTTDIEVSSPQLWSPEHPELYTVDVSFDSGGTVETVSEQIGLREIDIDGSTMVLNGEPVELRGVNWEEMDLVSDGHAIAESKTRADAQMLKEANVNYIRTAHHPVSEAFLDECDKLGILIEEEAPFVFVGSRRPSPYPATVRRAVAEMIARDRNRTCVCLWSIANESQWDPVFGTATELAVDMDPTRPVIFNAAEHFDGAAWLEYNDLAAHHYAEFRDGSTVDAYDQLGKPTTFDEFGHTYSYNDAELVTDPGLRYEWDRLFDYAWTEVRDGPDVAGAALWAGGDHIDGGISEYTPAYGEYLWGAVDRYRRERPEYWGMKKAYAPVQVTGVDWASDGSEVKITFENRHTFVDLSQRTVEYTSGSDSGTLSVSAPPQGGTDTVPVPVPGSSVSITVTHPQGFTINEFDFSPSAPSPNTPTTGTSETFTDTGSAYELSTANFTISVDQSTGDTTVTNANGQTQVVGGPNLAISELQSSTGRNYDQPTDHTPTGRTVTGVSLAESGSAVTVDLSYDVADGTVLMRPLAEGIEVEYDFTLSTNLSIREYGLSIPATTGHTDLSWVRDGYWSTYPSDHIGRTSGSATAFPSGSQPTNDGLVLDESSAWRHDETARGSNDFRSTKRNVYTGTVTNADGNGVRVHSNATKHVRCEYRGDTVDLLAIDESFSSSTPGFLDRHAVRDQTPTFASGATLSGATTVSIV